MVPDPVSKHLNSVNPQTRHLLLVKLETCRSLHGHANPCSDTDLPIKRFDTVECLHNLPNLLPNHNTAFPVKRCCRCYCPITPQARRQKENSPKIIGNSPEKKKTIPTQWQGNHKMPPSVVSQCAVLNYSLHRRKRGQQKKNTRSKPQRVERTLALSDQIMQLCQRRARWIFRCAKFSSRRMHN